MNGRRPGELPPQVAIVGSPSTNARLTLNLTGDAYDQGLVGAMVYLRMPLGDDEECALGTVSQVSTTNQWHQNLSLLGVVKKVGEIPGLTGDGDIRTADVQLQATFHRSGPSWTKSGPSLSMSPSTGIPVRRLANHVITALLSESERADLAYLGTIYRNGDLLLPTNMRDFADDRGALHTGVFGTTGSGKSAMASMMLGCQLRHERLGVLFIDPQGQFANDDRTLIPLQGLAKAVGRRVKVLRIAHDIQLDKDAQLFGDMLATTDLFERLDSRAQKTTDIYRRLLADFLESHDGWSDAQSGELLRKFLDHLQEEETLKKIIGTKDRRLEIAAVLARTASEPAWSRLLRIWAPLHSLFRSVNLAGEHRRTLWNILKEVLAPDIPGPRPYVVLDMSRQTSGDTSFDLAMLDDEDLKARLLLMIVGKLNAVAEESYDEGRPLNTLVMFDEAHRYAPPPTRDHSDEVRNLTTALARYARETRKYGIGWTYITQNIASLNRDIFGMLQVRVCGYGLGGSDLGTLEDHVDSRESLDLYRTFANPEQTGDYTYMITGPFSPLSFTKAPLFTTALTPEAWVLQNAHWISAHAERNATGADPKVSLNSLRSFSPGPRARSAPGPAGGGARSVRTSLAQVRSDP